jgi:hypothetical protein
MPSIPFELPARRLGETWLLLAMTAALAILLAGSAGMGVGGAMPAALPFVALMLLRLARRAQSHCLHRSVFMVAAGSIGLLLGARIDFGPLGLITLADWCTSPPALGFDVPWSTATLAPWTYAGMLAGCNLGMALSEYFLRSAADRGKSILHYLACNAGMLVGMFLAEASVPLLTPMNAGGSAPAVMFWLMVLGMTAGMWAGWWSADSLRRVFGRIGPGRSSVVTSS